MPFIPVSRMKNERPSASNRILILLLSLLCAAPAVAQQSAKPAPKPDKIAPKTTLTAPTPKAAPEVAEMDGELNLDAEAFKPRPVDTSQGLAVIAFGSCNKLNKPQSMWQFVADNNPNLWIWLGDIIYADTTDMRALAGMYKSLKTNAEYKKLRAKAQIIGVYDDHDFGANDAGKGYPKKKASKKCLMDFLDVPGNAPVRKREGAYTSYLFGKGAQRIKVIVLDTRYFRDTLIPDPSKQRRYLPNLEGDVLGEAQWKWLEKELKTSPANLNILCSSIQILADEHGYEKWGNFPNARKRMLNLIVQSKPKNLLIVSGDRHMAEVSKMDLQGLPYPLYDFTSSGITHIRSGLSEINKLRVGDLVLKKNFGLLKVYWENDHPVVTMQARGLQNELLLEIKHKY